MGFKDAVSKPQPFMVPLGSNDIIQYNITLWGGGPKLARLAYWVFD